MFCSNCGYQIADGVKFCPKCGEKNVQNAVSRDEIEYVEATVVSEGGVTNDSRSNDSAATGFAVTEPAAASNTNYIQESKFDGAGIELLGYMLLASLVTTVTCGIAAPWMICKIYKWRISHTVINGKRLTFSGTGGSLFGHYILWTFLTIITLGIYGFFMFVAIRKWELSHTYIEGEPMDEASGQSFFDGGTLAFIGYGLLGTLLLVITCGIAYPWVMSMLQKWDAGHQVINGRRLNFDGNGLGFLGEYLLIMLFTIITCGIYSPWATVRMNRYIIKHTSFIN